MSSALLWVQFRDNLEKHGYDTLFTDNFTFFLHIASRSTVAERRDGGFSARTEDDCIKSLRITQLNSRIHGKFCFSEKIRSA